MSEYLKNMIKHTGNKDADIVGEGTENDTKDFIDTGSYAFNALVSGSMYGGIPDNKILALAGESATGKTWFALSLVKSYLDKHKEGICLYFDTESAVNKEMIETRGIDSGRVAILPIATVEQFRNQAINLVEKYLESPKNERKPIILVLDSLGMLSSNKELKDSVEGNDVIDMTRAKQIRAIFRVLTMKLGKAQIPLIMTNHTYDSMSTYSQKIMSGGQGLRFAASTVIYLSKRKEKVDDEVVGNIIHCSTYKSRFTKENQTIDVLLRYDTGLNKYYGLLELAEQFGIFKKVSTRFELPDGSKVFGKNILDEPEKFFTKEIMDKIEENVGKKFKYGVLNEVDVEVSDAKQA